VTRDESHLTRGRANTLRLALTGQLGAGAMASDAVSDAMALCVSCKACRRECPTGIDMAKMKIEVLAARADRNGVARRDWLVAKLPHHAPLLARLAPLTNLRNRIPALRRLLEHRTGIAAARPLPAWRRDAFRDSEAAAPSSAGGREVMLFADTFNRWFEPENLRAALRVLSAAGYRVRMPASPGRPLCCGRTFLSAGLVDQARAEARRTLDALAGDIPVIGLEPACLLTLRDEFRSLLPAAATDALADRAFLLSEFLAREKARLPLRPMAATAHVHGHCHQKAFGAFPAALDTLKQVPGLSVKPIASSCCGMAGTFGYQPETQAVSHAMAEAGLLPAVRAAAADDIVIADGTSCRHQIRDLAGRQAMHSVRLLEQALAS
jgi:Fe-S oxidoreductase